MIKSVKYLVYTYYSMKKSVDLGRETMKQLR